jgi:hypothetical protein
MPMPDSNPLCERNMVDSNRRVRHRMRRFGSFRRHVGINMEENSNCAPSPARRGGMAVCPSVYLLLLMMLPLALEEAGITLALTSYTLHFLYLERERPHTLHHATSCDL